MREGKLVLASGRSLPVPWSADVSAERAARSVWSFAGLGLARWRARKETTLFQRCLAVHIYHASQHSSLR